MEAFRGGEFDPDGISDLYFDVRIILPIHDELEVLSGYNEGHGSAAFRRCFLALYYLFWNVRARDWNFQ